MKMFPARRAVARLSLGALAALGLVSVPTVAHGAADGILQNRTGVFAAGACEGADNGDETEIAWTDNNVPVSSNLSFSQTFTGEEGDVVDAAASSNGSIASSPLGGPATVTGSVTASSSAVSRGSSTECDAQAVAQQTAAGSFTLTQPMWATLTASVQGKVEGKAAANGFIAVATDYSVIGGSDVPLPFLGGEGLVVSTGHRGSVTSRTLLKPGDYQVGYSAFAVAEASETDEGSASYAGTFKIEFEPLGTASPVTGKAASKVQFGERDCASGDVSVNLSKKTVKKAERVAVRVNGAKGPVLEGRSLKGRKPKAKTLLIPTSVTGLTKVKVKITLANGRRMQATRSYLPCR